MVWLEHSLGEQEERRAEGTLHVKLGFWWPLRGLQSPALGHSATVTAVQHGASAEQECALITFVPEMPLVWKVLVSRGKIFPRSLFQRFNTVSHESKCTCKHRNRHISSVGKGRIINAM